jgi:hypothetical protein
MRPESIAAFTVKLPACIVAMEACRGAHHLGRVMSGQGHQVRSEGIEMAGTDRLPPWFGA